MGGDPQMIYEIENNLTILKEGGSGGVAHDNSLGSAKSSGSARKDG